MRPVSAWAISAVGRTACDGPPRPTRRRAPAPPTRVRAWRRVPAGGGGVWICERGGLTLEAKQIRGGSTSAELTPTSGVGAASGPGRIYGSNPRAISSRNAHVAVPRVSPGPNTGPSPCSIASWTRIASPVRSGRARSPRSSSRRPVAAARPAPPAIAGPCAAPVRSSTCLPPWAAAASSRDRHPVQLRCVRELLLGQHAVLPAERRADPRASRTRSSSGTPTRSLWPVVTRACAPSGSSPWPLRWSSAPPSSPT